MHMYSNRFINNLVMPLFDFCANTLTTASITQLLFMIFKWNLVHKLPETIHKCIAWDITLDLIFINIWPIFYFDRTEERWRSVHGAYVKFTDYRSYLFKINKYLQSYSLMDY